MQNTCSGQWAHVSGSMKQVDAGEAHVYAVSPICIEENLMDQAPGTTCLEPALSKSLGRARIMYGQ